MESDKLQKISITREQIREVYDQGPEAVETLVFNNMSPEAIINEVQRVPDFFSYLQEIVDENKSIKYILSGSPPWFVSPRTKKEIKST